MTFDEYCEKHDIQPNEAPAAFGAWLNSETGWDGKINEVSDADR